MSNAPKSTLKLLKYFEFVGILNIHEIVNLMNIYKNLFMKQHNINIHEVVHYNEEEKMQDQIPQ